MTVPRPPDLLIVALPYLVQRIAGAAILVLAGVTIARWAGWIT